MSNFIDLSGRQFGKLTVVRKVSENKGIHPCFECLCECGNTFIARSDKLRSGRTLSCGCMHDGYLKNHPRVKLEVGGGVMSIKEFCDTYHISKEVLRRRLKSGLTPDDIVESLTTPGGKK